MRPASSEVRVRTGPGEEKVHFSDSVSMIRRLPSTRVVANILITLYGANYAAFEREALVSSYAAIREFLREHTIVTKE